MNELQSQVSLAMLNKNDQENPSKKEKFWFYLLSHHERTKLDRTIHLRLFHRDVYLCGRCTFRYSALVISLLVMIYTGFTPQILYEYFLILWVIIVVFPVTSSLAWIHQFLTKKDNPKVIRYVTGSMIGISEAVGISCLFFLEVCLILLYLITYLAIMGLVGVILLKKGI